MIALIKLIKRILQLAGTYRGRIQVAFILSAIKAMLSQMPIYVGFLVLLQFTEQTMTPAECAYAGIVLLVIVLAGAVAHLLSDKLQSGAGYMMFADKRVELGAHLKKLPMGYFTAGNIGKISSVLSTDMIFIEEICMSTIADMMSYIFNAALMILFMFFLHIRLGIIMLALTIVINFLAGKMNRISLTEGEKRQKQSESLTSAVLAFVEGIGIIKSYNLLGKKSKELSDNFKESNRKALGFEEKLSPWHLALFLLYGVGTTLLFGYGIFLQGAGMLSVPYLLGMLLFVFNAFGPLKSLYSQATRLTVMSSCLDRIEAVFAETELPDIGTKRFKQAGEKTAEIAFDKVTFAYNQKDVISDVSFSLKKNTMTALVGPSGGGKSTIANLLTRFWDIREGAIRIRGVDIREIPLAELMNHISMVFQRVYLFQDTVYNNISMGKQNATQEEVYEAARKARCYDFIMQLPEGFDTMIGEGGATLSGGEKQRISIARCILKDAPIVILDEATASVDLDNERYIQEAISELVKGKTLLVIAHRLNTIVSANKILVIADGKITQSGTHQELMQQEGTYRDFVRLRQNAEKRTIL